MSKELKAFVRLEQSSKRYKGRKEDLDTIFTTLKRLESIGDTRFIILGGRCSGKTQKTNALLKLKAFEIISDKICVGFILGLDNKYVYVLRLKNSKHFIEITKEQYDFLKEVLL